MSDITPTTFAKYRPNPLLAVLPEYLKKPENYDKVMKAIIDAGATKHSHGEVVDWAACTYCQGKQLDRLRMMKKLGFTSPDQYRAWHKVHNTIKERMKLDKYNQ